MTSNFSCFENGYRDEPSTSWPAHFSFSPDTDIFRLSVQSEWKLNVFSHLFLLNYDTLSSPPRTMTIQLPVLENLPTQSRLYFTYVENCENTDVLTFSVVPGSGDLVNHDPTSYSFTLNGESTLYIICGFHGNWLVRPFGNRFVIPPPITNDYYYYNYYTTRYPLVHWNYQVNDISRAGPIADWYPWGQNAVLQYNGATETHISPGLSGILTYAETPMAGIYGFTSTQSGYFSVNINSTISFHVGGGDTLHMVCGRIYEIEPGVGNRTIANFPVLTTGYGGTPQFALIGNEVKIQVVQGNFYIIAILWYCDLNTANITFTSDEYNTKQGVYWQWLDFPDIAPPTMLSSLRANAPAGSLPVKEASNPSRILVEASLDRNPIKKLQLDKQKQDIIQGIITPLQNENEQTSFTLNDVENIVEKALAQAVEQAQKRESENSLRVGKRKRVEIVDTKEKEEAM